MSDNMVKLYNETARTQGISKDNMIAIQGDLLAPSQEMIDSMKASQYEDFNIIVMSMALHHVSDPQLMLTRLVERLAEGGTILIIDWANEAVYSWPSTEALKKAGLEDVKHTLNDAVFSEESVVKLLKDAGCKTAEFVLSPEASTLPLEFGGEKRMFFGLGRK